MADSMPYSDQKLYVYNLRYRLVAFLDADIIVAKDPRPLLTVCEKILAKEHAVCAVQVSDTVLVVTR